MSDKHQMITERSDGLLVASCSCGNWRREAEGERLANRASFDEAFSTHGLAERLNNGG